MDYVAVYHEPEAFMCAKEPEITSRFVIRQHQQKPNLVNLAFIQSGEQFGKYFDNIYVLICPPDLLTSFFLQRRPKPSPAK